MKKFFLLLSAAVWLFASCEGPAGRDGLEGRPGRDGKDGKDGVETYWYVGVYTINSSNWQLVNGVDQLNSYYRASITISELTNDIYEDGTVFCYLFQTIDNREVQTPLPFTVPLGEAGSGNTNFLWTETVAYDFAPGRITFYVNYSDFFTSNRPGTMIFRVVLNY